MGKGKKMDGDEVSASFYKAELQKLIEETLDLSLLDLVYKILLQARA